MTLTDGANLIKLFIAEKKLYRSSLVCSPLLAIYTPVYYFLLILYTENTFWRRRLSTVDLLVRTDLLMQILYTFLQKQATLMWRLTVQGLPLQLVFLAVSYPCGARSWLRFKGGSLALTWYTRLGCFSIKAISACKDKLASLQDRSISCRSKKIYKNWQQTSKEFPKIFFLSTFFPKRCSLDEFGL
jgi:hypothetical protein